MLFILSSISSGLEIWSVNHTSIYENFEWNLFKNIKFLSEITNNWPNDLSAANVFKTLKLLTTLQWTHTTLVISKWGTFSPFSSLVI